MRIYRNKNVKDAAIERINLLFDEFENVVVGFSGGKDSTVCLNLSLEIARERGRLPLKVLWIDQEAEWQGTVDYCTRVFENPEIDPYWFQMPMVITNNASSYNRYSNCWKAEDEDIWVHPQHPISIKENKYGTERFHELFEAIFRGEFAGQKSCYISGVRTEESPKRFMALTNAVTYKWITWGKVLNKDLEHYSFYPIYDWSYRDVWKYIDNEDLDYNIVYDELYRMGHGLNTMRISNLHHETGIQTLMQVQEIEPQTWNRLVDRIDGASSIKHIKSSSFQCPADLPYMFKDWEEYAYYLAENLIQEEQYKKLWYRKVELSKELYNRDLIKESYWKALINTILSSDWDFSKYTNWTVGGAVNTFRKYHKNPLGKRTTDHVWDEKMLLSTKYLHPHEIHEIIDFNNKKRNEKRNKKRVRKGEK